MPKQKLSLQLRLNEALSTDLGIFNKYLNKEVLLDIVGGNCISGTLISNGIEFISLKNIKHYKYTSNSYVDSSYMGEITNPNELLYTEPSIDLKKSEIERARSLEDFIKTCERGKNATR